MKKYIIDEKTGISYTLQEDYYIPDLTLPLEEETRPVGVWGLRHKRYLMEHKKATFTIMQINGTLQSYLADINEHAEDMFFRLVNNMAKSEGVTEQLKATDQMAWVGAMNSIRNRAVEIINSKLIYV